MNFFDEIESVLDPVKFFSRNSESLSATEADPDEKRIELLLQIGCGNLLAHLDAASDLDAQSLDHRYLLETSLRLHLIIGYAIRIEAPWQWLPFKDHHAMAKLG